jgi:hypothetical protein
VRPEPDFLGAATILFLAPTRDGDQQHLATPRLLPDSASNFLSIKPRQTDIQQHHLGLLRRCRLDGLETAMSHLYLVPMEGRFGSWATSSASSASDSAGDARRARKSRGSVASSAAP